ncbi:MAG: hypothetical protein KDA62_10045 [Planctomycetales bacterium]|nr:hypothetical protein [Planctomycetales bacterium]
MNLDSATNAKTAAAPDPLAASTGVETLPTRRRARASRPGLSLLASGEPMIWLTGGALVICLVMIVG